MSSGRKSSSGTAKRSLPMCRICASSMGGSPGARTRPPRCAAKSGRIYSCTMELCARSTLPRAARQRIRKNKETDRDEKSSRQRPGSSLGWGRTRGGHAPARLDVPLVVERDEAALLLDVVHDVRLVHHVPLAERDELFELVCEQLAADVEPWGDVLGRACREEGERSQ